MPAPLVSIVIPVRNGMPYLPETLASTRDSGVDDLEILVRENGSTDGTREWLDEHSGEGFRLLVADPPSGAAENWTAVAEAARGRYIKLLCADDFLLPGGLRRQLDAALAEPDAVLVASRRRVVDHRGRTLIRRRGLTRMIGRMPGARAAAAATYSGVNPFGEPSSVLFRADALRAALPFRSDYPYVTDLQMYVKVLQHGAFVGLGSVDAAFRVSTGSWSAAIGRRQLSELRAWAWDATARGEVTPTRIQRFAAEPRFVASFLARRAVSGVAGLLER